MRESQSDPIMESLRYALLAPSSHNTQPWRFEIAQDTVWLHADRTRRLPVNDPADRELAISCGCALMNLRVAAARHGLRAETSLCPESADPDLLARVSFRRTTAYAPESALFASIERRRTYRKRFKERAVPPSMAQALAASAQREGAALHFPGGEEVRDYVAGLVEEGDAAQWSNPEWRRELAAWMLPRRRGEGLTVSGPIAPLIRALVRRSNMGKRLGAADRKLAFDAPVLGILATDGDGVVDWLRAGQALEHLLLTGCASGLQASYLNQPIQVASLRTRLREHLNLTGYPQVLLRIGFAATEPAPSPRRSLSEVVAPRAAARQRPVDSV